MYTVVCFFLRDVSLNEYAARDLNVAPTQFAQSCDIVLRALR